jgi:3-hydroxyisobutyrate dehydrogenase-like beta-hydroxyacid dehydrogenase
MRIAFLGLGHLGQPMAQNLLGAGHAVTVYNRTPGKAGTLVASGAVEAHSVAEVVKRVEVAITMLSDDGAVADVVQGPGGLLQNLPPKAIHLCMGSIGVETSTKLASLHAQAKQGYVAAPIFRGAHSTEPRHSWIVAGGPEPQVNRCRPIFEALGRGYSRVSSKAPLAHAVKLGSNILSVAMELAVSELLIFAEKAGLPPADYLRFLNTAVFRAHMVNEYGGVSARPSFDPEDQTLDLAASELVLQKAWEMGAQIPVVDLLQVRLQAASARGWGDQNLAELSEACERETGVGEPPVPEPGQVPVNGRAVPKPALRRKEVAPREAAPPPPGGPQLVAPNLVKETHTPPAPVPPASAPPPSTGANTSPKQVLVQNLLSAFDGQDPLTLDLDETSHFEIIKGQVWVWSEGKCYRTAWRTFAEVEMAFFHILFLPIQRIVLLRPEAALELRPTFGGGAKVRVGGNLELTVGREAARRLKELMGI